MRPGCIQRPVVLTQMNAIGIHRGGQLNIVVDDKQGAVVPAELAQGFGLATPPLLPGALVAILDDGGPADERPFHIPNQSGTRSGVRNGVDAAYEMC